MHEFSSSAKTVALPKFTLNHKNMCRTKSHVLTQKWSTSLSSIWEDGELTPHLPSRIMVTVAMSGRRWCRRRRHQECSASSHDLRITVQMRIRCTNDVTYLWSNLDTPLDWKTITKWDMEIYKTFKFSRYFFFRYQSEKVSIIKTSTFIKTVLEFSWMRNSWKS